MIIGITGHRPQQIDNNFDYTSSAWQWIRSELTKTFEFHKPDMIISGMALGVDMLAVEVALDLGIKVRAAVPFEGQELKWPTAQQKIYRDLLSKCNDVFMVSDGGYAPWKLHARNQFIVDNSHFMVAVWNGNKLGGTFSTVVYAEKRERSIYQIDPVNKKVSWL